MSLIQKKDVRAWIGRRPIDSNKGTSGHALIVAGSRGLSGAAVLSALGALRAGAGLVSVAIPDSERHVVTHQLPEVLTLGLAEDKQGCLHAKAEGQIANYILKKRVNVFAIGPGVSVSPSVRRVVLGLLKRVHLPRVVDADALNNMQMGDFKGWPGTVITPHPGELARLTKKTVAQIQTSRVETTLETARQGKLVCVLKGHRTLISDGNRVLANPTGNPAMAAGGMGDVLTGGLAALLAQGLDPFLAAAAAVYLHGLAGDLAAITDRGLLATELADALPRAIQHIIGSHD